MAPGLCCNFQEETDHAGAGLNRGSAKAAQEQEEVHYEQP